ncbi:hypothetical protein DMH88_04830 [Escherichia coli]|nr:hypothetical protein [Escherichia coli]
MQQALIAKGVPAKPSSATMPDSQRLIRWCVPTRCLSENHITIISQEFHNQRASGWQNSMVSMLSVLTPRPEYEARFIYSTAGKTCQSQRGD